MLQGEAGEGELGEGEKVGALQLLGLVCTPAGVGQRETVRGTEGNYIVCQASPELHCAFYVGIHTCITYLSQVPGKTLVDSSRL